MTLEELAERWDTEARHNEQRADDCRSIDAYVRYQAYAQQLRWCATQLRLVTRPPVVVRFDGQLSGEAMKDYEERLRKAVHRAAPVIQDGQP